MFFKLTSKKPIKPQKGDFYMFLKDQKRQKTLDFLKLFKRTKRTTNHGLFKLTFKAPNVDLLKSETFKRGTKGSFLKLFKVH